MRHEKSTGICHCDVWLRFKRLVSLALCGINVVVFCVAPAIGQADSEAVDAAVQRFQFYLLNSQNEDGSWERDFATSADAAGGETALVVYALLASGMPHQTPQIQKALDWLETRQAVFMKEPSLGRTYTVSLLSHVWAQLPAEYEPLLKQSAQWLLKANDPSDGRFDYYFSPRTGYIDHTATQYGVLGLWEYSKRGGIISSSLWEKVAQHLIDTQERGGYWSDSNHVHSDVTVTCAALTSLMVARLELTSDRGPPDQHINTSIERGLRWLDQHFKVSNPTGNYHNFYRYGIERVALLSGRARFSDMDWFQTMSTAILKQEAGRGYVGAHDETAFALLFLARGRVPVWIAKLQPDNRLEYGTSKWANKRHRLNELYHLNQWLGRMFERELLWQTVRMDDTVMNWRGIPLLWISSESAWHFSSNEKNKIKHYLDLGGTLVINQEQGNQNFKQEIYNLLTELYPTYHWQPMQKEHPLLGSVFPVALGPNIRPLVFSNDARDLAYLLPDDWGKIFVNKTDLDAEGSHSEKLKMIVNLYAATSDRGRQRNRYRNQTLMDVDTDNLSTFTILRVQHEGNWLPEPAAYWPLNQHLIKRAGMRIVAKDIALHELDVREGKLAHLCGTEAIKLSNGQLEKIKHYVRNGGTFIVENVGGHGNFSETIEAQLEQAFQRPSVYLQRNNRILSGKQLSNGYDLRKISYRSWYLQQSRLGSRPSLKAIYSYKNRPGVLISHQDLSVGFLGTMHHRIAGYSVDSSRQLMTNIILHIAPKQRLVSNH